LCCCCHFLVLIKFIEYFITRMLTKIADLYRENVDDFDRKSTSLKPFLLIYTAIIRKRFFHLKL
jgi:hypothetical protein